MKYQEYFHDNRIDLEKIKIDKASEYDKNGHIQGLTKVQKITEGSRLLRQNEGHESLKRQMIFDVVPKDDNGKLNNIIYRDIATISCTPLAEKKRMHIPYKEDENSSSSSISSRKGNNYVQTGILSSINQNNISKRNQHRREGERFCKKFKFIQIDSCEEDANGMILVTDKNEYGEDIALGYIDECGETRSFDSPSISKALDKKKAFYKLPKEYPLTCKEQSSECMVKDRKGKQRKKQSNIQIELLEQIKGKCLEGKVRLDEKRKQLENGIFGFKSQNGKSDDNVIMLKDELELLEI